MTLFYGCNCGKFTIVLIAGIFLLLFFLTYWGSLEEVEKKNKGINFGAILLAAL